MLPVLVLRWRASNTLSRDPVPLFLRAAEFADGGDGQAVRWIEALLAQTDPAKRIKVMGDEEAAEGRGFAIARTL